MAGAPTGNNNAAKGTRWRHAIDKALAKRSKAEGIEALDKLAEELLKLCDKGDLSALKELGDRIDGKSTQPIVGHVDHRHSHESVSDTSEWLSGVLKSGSTGKNQKPSTH